MPDNISTLEDIEKPQTEKMTTKQSEQSGVCASVLKYILARNMRHNIRQVDNNFIFKKWYLIYKWSQINLRLRFSNDELLGPDCLSLRKFLRKGAENCLGKFLKQHTPK